MDATIGTMLDRAQEYLDEMTRFFADFRDRSTDDVARLFTYRIARHRKSLQQLRDMLSEAELNAVRSMPLGKSNDDFEPQRVFEGRFLPAGAQPAEVLAAAVEFMDVLGCLYEWLAGQFSAPEVHALLVSLARSEAEEAATLREIRGVVTAANIPG